MKIKTILLSLATCGSLTMALAVRADTTLTIGDPAPKLQVAKWVQGDPVTSFEPGKAYIVEFWATWCPPCRASIPHLNERYEKVKDQGIVVIGQDVAEKKDDGVAPFVTKMGDKMTYRVALDDKSTEPRGAMLKTWMKAAGQNFIPRAFVVNKKGQIAWIGSPTELNETVLATLLADSYDLHKAAADFAAEQKKSQ